MSLSRRLLAIFDDIEHHEIDCDCGRCDGKGKSYGYAIYNAPEGRNDPDETLLNEVRLQQDPIERIYGPSETAAESNALRRIEELFDGQ